MHPDPLPASASTGSAYPTRAAASPIAHICRAQVQSLQLLLIDAQSLFWETMSGDEGATQRRVAHLLMLAEVWQLPTLATLEQPVERKGSLPEALRRRLPSSCTVCEKDAYDCLRDEPIRTALARAGRQQVAVAGAETDVCVLQSVLSLCAAGYDAFVIADCVFSSAADTRLALRRMERAGAVLVTLKSLAYELGTAVSQTPWLPEYAGESVVLPAEFSDPETW